MRIVGDDVDRTGRADADLPGLCLLIRPDGIHGGLFYNVCRHLLLFLLICLNFLWHQFFPDY